jgi:DNA-binding response OmpR family regulator
VLRAKAAVKYNGRGADVDGDRGPVFKLVRANPATRNTPMMVLSSKEEPVIKAKAFALGANDYPVKLPGPIELVARVRYRARAYLRRPERDEAYRRLAEGQRQLAEGSPRRPATSSRSCPSGSRGT